MLHESRADSFLRHCALQAQVHVLEDKDLLDRPRDTLVALNRFLGVAMHELPSWDKEDVQSTLQNTYVLRTHAWTDYNSGACVKNFGPTVVPNSESM